MWVVLAFCSALMLGVYDVFKKMSLDGNAVIPVLFFNVLCACIFLLPLLLISFFAPEITANTLFELPRIGLKEHLLLFVKAFIVLSSWIAAYFSVKHLPLTIASPIKAFQPILTLVGALLIFGERLNVYQWIGVALGLTSLFLLSRSGHKEGIDFKHNRWIWLMLLAIVLGACSGLYDKFLLRHIDRMNVQVWFNFYQLALMLPIVALLWWPNRRKTTPFAWRKTIPLIALFLLAADFLYFYALSLDGALISVISLIRRSSVAVSFTVGAMVFRERNLRAKALDLALILLGMLIIGYGSLQ